MKKRIALGYCCISFFSFSYATESIEDDSMHRMYPNGLTIHQYPVDFKPEKWLRRDEGAKFFVEFSKLLGKSTYI